MVVASVCRIESLMRTIRGAVVVQQDSVGMYMAILSLRGREGMMFEKTSKNSDSEQK